MDVDTKNKYCGYIMFNTSSASSKGPGSRGNDLVLNNYDAPTFSNCDSDLYPQTGITNNSMAAGAAAVDEQNVKKEDNPFQIYDPSNNNDNSKKLPGSSKMQPEKRPPRPPNAFILYRRAKQPAILAAHRNLTNAEISRYISNCWKNEPEQERLNWERYADQKKLEHMQAYPNYVYRPNKNKGKNEKRRQARKNTFNSQDSTNAYESGETGPIRTKKSKGQSNLKQYVGKIEIPMGNKVVGLQDVSMMTPPLSLPNTPTILDNGDNIIYTTMPMTFPEPEEINLSQDITLPVQEAIMQFHQQNDFSGLFSDPPTIFSYPTGDDFYSSHQSSFDSTTSSNPDFQKINTTSCSLPEFRYNNINAQGLEMLSFGQPYSYY